MASKSQKILNAVKEQIINPDFPGLLCKVMLLTYKKESTLVVGMKPNGKSRFEKSGGYPMRLKTLASSAVNFFLLLAAWLFINVSSPAEPAARTPAIICPPDAPPMVKLAAKELRRYIFLRTDKLLPIANKGEGITLQLDKNLAAQQYRLKGDGRTLAITGGSEVAVLYGAYDLAEKLGVRFYLHGDVIPDRKIAFTLPRVDETHSPLFETRGIQPFHDFPEGPDWWNQDDYLAYLSQLAKLRMNFIGLHCYPEGGVGPEPLVWIGLTNDLAPNGQVRFSYPAFWANTLNGIWGYAPMRTGEFSGGAALLFPGDSYGPNVMKGLLPRPATLEQDNELFNRVGEQFHVITAAAQQLGIKTCLGTETPLTIPKALQEHFSELGKKPDDPAVRRELYTAMFKRIAQLYPVDYYWLWTPENWTWHGNNPAEFAKTTEDIQAALDALKLLDEPFTLATCGWVLGPQHDRAALDEFLPKNSPMSCINRNVGHDGVEPAFANITGRPKWAIPWMENDPNLVGPQCWAARMRYDAVDARRFGCTGLIGIHWRTKAMAPNVAALAAAAWDQSWVPANFDTAPVKPQKTGEGALGGKTASFAAPVAGTTKPAVYQTVRFNLNGYSLAVPDGTYVVTLQFNEPVYSAVGKRIFGVKIQGRQVLTNLDIFARAGRNSALDLDFPGITVPNGSLEIEFTKQVEFPCIAGIVITGQTKAGNQLAGETFTRKINCGGGQLGDYEADRTGGLATAAAPRTRAMPVADFYFDFARANFGDEIARPAGKIFAAIDGVHLPSASNWKSGPGTLTPLNRPWAEEKKHYAFVDELAALRPQIKGAGNQERFDYWLNTYRAMSLMAEARCACGLLDQTMLAVRAKKTPVAAVLAQRVELAKIWSQLLTLQAAIVSTPGELGTIANLEEHTRQHEHFVEADDEELIQALGSPLPPETVPAKNYGGPARLTVPTVRTCIRPGETLQLTIIALDQQPVRQVAVNFHPLGQGSWQTNSATHVGRAIYTVKLPAAQDDFEYFISAHTAGGEELVWPATAPAMNQTVVVAE